MHVITFNHSKFYSADHIGTEFAFGEITENRQSLTCVLMGEPAGKTLKHPETREKHSFAMDDLIFPVTKASVDALREFLYLSELLSPMGSEYKRSAPYYHHHHGPGFHEKFEMPGRLPTLPSGRVTHDWDAVNQINEYYDLRPELMPPEIPLARTSCWTGALFLMQDIAGIDLGIFDPAIQLALSRLRGACLMQYSMFDHDKRPMERDLINLRTDENICFSMLRGYFAEEELPAVYSFSGVSDSSVGGKILRNVDIPLEVFASQNWTKMNGELSDASPHLATLWGRGSFTQYQPTLEPQSLHRHHG